MHAFQSKYENKQNKSKMHLRYSLQYLFIFLLLFIANKWVKHSFCLKIENL